MLIYIISASGKPLMPTHRQGHVRRLLNKGKARIVSKTPYVVQLRYETDEVTQPLMGGTDPGRTNIGETVVTADGEVIYKAHVTTRNKDVPRLMAKKKQHRQASRYGERQKRKRRARKCGTTTTFPEGRMLPGYEKPVMVKDIINTESRFNNRKRPKDWINPTTRHLVQTHINMTRKICSILPVTDWTMEYNKFVFMRMEDGTIQGVDFQNGRLRGFKDSHEYVSSLQNGKCACCGSSIEHFHHIKPRSRGGSDTPENLIGLCNNCHMKVHSGDIDLSKIGFKKKYAAISILNQAMPYIAQELIRMFGEDHVTFCSGCQTMCMRDELCVSKDHPEDAVCIAAYGLDLNRIEDSAETFEIGQFRRHDRARIKSQHERTYYLNGKAVCKNRHKRTDQKDDSLEEFRQKHPSDVKLLSVKKSKRYYNIPDRLFPGTVFMYMGELHVMSGQLTNGKYLRAIGDDKTNYPATQCRIVQKNTGLVYL